MIYILVGNDFKKKNAYIKKLGGGEVPVVLSLEEKPKEAILYYSESVNLFGNSPSIIVEDFLKTDLTFKSEEWAMLKESKTPFFFLEDKLTSTEINKLKKYAVIETFETKASVEKLKSNTFNIADSFAKKDKMNTWLLYKEAVSRGSSPEEISGILFWKVKTLLLNGSQVFSKEELKCFSSELVSLYHMAHLGKKDFVIGLEQFILSSLDKKGSS